MLSACRYPHKAIINSIIRHKNTLHRYKKEIWRLDTKTLIEKEFSWECQPIWEANDSEIRLNGQPQMPHEDEICLVVDATDIGEVLALANNKEGHLGNQTFVFASKPIEFGTDNCATHHICYEKDL